MFGCAGCINLNRSLVSLSRSLLNRCHCPFHMCVCTHGTFRSSVPRFAYFWVGTAFCSIIRTWLMPWQPHLLRSANSNRTLAQEKLGRSNGVAALCVVRSHSPRSLTDLQQASAAALGLSSSPWCTIRDPESSRPGVNESAISDVDLDLQYRKHPPAHWSSLVIYHVLNIE